MEEGDIGDNENSENPRIVDSVELGLQGGKAREELEIESRPTDAGLMPRRHHVHIMHEGREVATDDDEGGGGSGKHALGKASHSGLRYFAVAYSADEPDIDLFTSPDLRECHLIRTEGNVGSWVLAFLSITLILSCHP